MKNWIGAAAALSMMSTPALAAPTSSAPGASVAGAQTVRAGKPTENKEKLGQSGILIAALVGAGAIAGFIALAFDDDPSSP